MPSSSLRGSNIVSRLYKSILLISLPDQETAALQTIAHLDQEPSGPLPHLEGLLQVSAWYDGSTSTAMVKEI